MSSVSTIFLAATIYVRLSSTRHSQRGRLTKIFALGISTPPAHVLVHARAHAEEVRIAALDGQCEGGDGQHRGGQREQPAEPHRVLSCLVLRCFRVD